MIKRKTKALVLGPVPPPVHGFSIAMQNLFFEMKKSSSVTLLNVAGRNSNKFIRVIQSLALSLFGCLKIIRSSSSQVNHIAIGCNGGLGSVFTLLLVAACRMINIDATLHHHSYNYINYRSRIMAVIVAISNSKIKHIFLSDSMEKEFMLQYKAVTSDVVSNAFIVDIPEKNYVRDKVFRVGMLSNLTREKGLLHFLELTDKARSIGLNINFILAGPVESMNDLREIQKREKEFPNLEYVGPIYGHEKDLFYKNIDTFVFPTDYHNEAQPIVLFEAMAHSVPVISIAKGCIREQVGDYYRIFESVEEFNKEILNCLLELSKMSIDEIETLRESTLSFFISQRQKSLKSILRITSH